MQHLGAEDQMPQVLHDFLASLTPKERLEGLSAEVVLESLDPKELERLRQLLQAQAKADNSSRPE
jgi:hypothetical protein